MKVILYIQDSGIPAVIFPAPEFADFIEAVAFKDVPEGKPFRIMEESDLPEGPQEDWEIDPATLTDGLGGAGSEFPTFDDDLIEDGNQ